MTSDRLLSERIRQAELWYAGADLGFEVIGDDGWDADTGSDEISKSLFVEAGGEHSVSQKLTVHFKPGTVQIDHANVDGEEVEGSQNWGRRPDRVICKICHQPCNAQAAHLHQGEYIGDECCWDERLRASE